MAKASFEFSYTFSSDCSENVGKKGFTIGNPNIIWVLEIWSLHRHLTCLHNFVRNAFNFILKYSESTLLTNIHTYINTSHIHTYTHIYMDVCVCVYVHGCVCICVCVCIYACVCMCVYVYVCICVCMCVYVYVSICVCVYVCVCMCPCVFVYMCVQVCVYVYVCVLFLHPVPVCMQFCKFCHLLPLGTQWPTLSKSITGFNVCARCYAYVHTRGLGL